MLVARAQPLLDDLEQCNNTADGRGDPARVFVALSRIVQHAQTAPEDLYASLGDVLKGCYFQTGVRNLRVLSYTLMHQCRGAWHDSHSDWDNVVGSFIKDIDSADADLQCAALKMMCNVPVAKMITHLERGRIQVLPCLASSSVAVRRQAAFSLSYMMRKRFSLQQLQAVAGTWVPAMTRMLWSDADSLPVAEVAAFLAHACGSVVGSVFAPLDEADALEQPEARWTPVVEHFTASFQSIEDFAIAAERMVEHELVATLALPLAVVLVARKRDSALTDAFLRLVERGNNASCLQQIREFLSGGPQWAERAWMLSERGPDGAELPDQLARLIRHAKHDAAPVEDTVELVAFLASFKGPMPAKTLALYQSCLSSKTRCVRSLFIEHLCRTLSTTEDAAERERIAQDIITHDCVEGSRAALIAAALYWPVSKLHHLVAVEAKLLWRLLCLTPTRANTTPARSDSMLGKGAGLAGSVKRLGDSQVIVDDGRFRSLNKRSGLRLALDQLVPDQRASGAAPAVHGGGERPVSSTVYALFVVAMRAPQLGAAKLIETIAQAQSDPVLKAVAIGYAKRLSSGAVQALPTMSTKQLSLFSPAFATQRPAPGSSDMLALSVLLAQSYPNGQAAASQIHLRGQREAAKWTRVSPDAAPVRVEMAHLVNFGAKRVTVHVRVVNDCALRLGALVVSTSSAWKPHRAILSELPSGASFDNAFSAPLDTCPPSLAFRVSVAMPDAPAAAAAGASQHQHRHIATGRTMHCAAYAPSVASVLLPLRLSSAQWSSLWAKLALTITETLLAPPSFALRRERPALYPCMLWSGDGTITAKLSSWSVFGTVVLVSVAAKRTHVNSGDWVVHAECRSFDKDTLRLIACDGGLAGLLEVPGTLSLMSSDQRNVFAHVAAQ